MVFRTQNFPKMLSLIYSDPFRLFLYIVLVPFVISGLYLYFISPDRYISESRLSVYDAKVSPAPSDLFSTLGLQSGQEQNDARLLQAYLYSPSLLQELDSEINIKGHYSASRDFLFGINYNSSIESFLKYFHKRMSAEIDTATGLIIIRTEAFDPDFSLLLNQLLLKKGEFFINNLNQSIALKEMSFSAEEMNRSLSALNNSQKELAKFQSLTNLANPEIEGESIITIAYQLEAALAEAKAQLRETLTYLSSESPQALALDSKIRSLEAQISETKSKLTGSESSGINDIVIEYQELLLEVELARTVYEASLSSFELARSQSSKQLKHLLVASNPTLAEDAVLPKRGYWLSTLVLLYLCVYGVLILVGRSIEEHRE